MNKSILSSVTLALAVMTLFAGLGMIGEPEFGAPVWAGILTLIAAVGLGIATWRLRVEVKKEDEAAAKIRKEKEDLYLRQVREEARLAREEEERRKKAERDRWAYETFPVAGVTFKNEDGSDRQKILREIALNDGGRTQVSFNEKEELGEDSGIEVLTEYGTVGFIRHRDKARMRKFFDRQTQTAYLSVERFESDDGQKIYRADVRIVMCRDDPEQAWYFDELPES